MKTWLKSAVLVGLLGSYGWGRYRKTRKAALEKLRAGSDIIQTRCGPVEYAITGEGPPVLVAHGILGHYGHGLISTRPLHDHFKIIAFSRPGYGRTPLRTGATDCEQGEVYAALLEALHIPAAPVIAISGAGPSALCFASQHPECCSGLVLMSAVSTNLDVSALKLSRLLSLFVKLRRFDLTMWLAISFIVYGLPLLWIFNRDLKERIYDDGEGHRMFSDLMWSFFPSSLARDGFANDVQIFAAEPGCDLDAIQAPALILHGEADNTIPPDQAEYAAQHLPHSRLVLVGEQANHPFYVTHRDQSWPLLIDFLQEHPGTLAG